MRKELTKKSKFLSLILRHDPKAAGLELDTNGWCDVQQLMIGASQAGVLISLEELFEIVETNEKRRFRLSEDRTRIRANQGHSVSIDLELKQVDPPDVLYHGTTTRFEESIRSKGLLKMKRHHVHLSGDLNTAKTVGMRHGKVLLLRINSLQMKRDGFKFYRSENDVWLVEEVPSKYIEP